MNDANRILGIIAGVILTLATIAFLLKLYGSSGPERPKTIAQLELKLRKAVTGSIWDYRQKRSYCFHQRKMTLVTPSLDFGELMKLHISSQATVNAVSVLADRNFRNCTMPELQKAQMAVHKYQDFFQQTGRDPRRFVIPPDDPWFDSTRTGATILYNAKALLQTKDADGSSADSAAYANLSKAQRTYLENAIGTAVFRPEIVLERLHASMNAYNSDNE